MIDEEEKNVEFEKELKGGIRFYRSETNGCQDEKSGNSRSWERKGVFNIIAMEKILRRQGGPVRSLTEKELAKVLPFCKGWSLGSPRL